MGIALLLCSHSWSRTRFGALIWSPDFCLAPKMYGATSRHSINLPARSCHWYFTWVSLSFCPHSFAEFFPPLALQFPPPHATEKSRREEGTLLAGPNSFRTWALRNCVLYSANRWASGSGCSRILYCCHFGHSGDLSLIQRRLHYLLKISQRSEILLLQAREFYIRL